MIGYLFIESLKTAILNVVAAIFFYIFCRHFSCILFLY